MLSQSRKGQKREVDRDADLPVLLLSDLSERSACRIFSTRLDGHPHRPTVRPPIHPVRRHARARSLEQLLCLRDVVWIEVEACATVGPRGLGRVRIDLVRIAKKDGLNALRYV